MPLTPEQTAQLKAAVDKTMENLVEALTAGGPSPFHAELCITEAGHILRSIQSAAARGRGGPVGPSPAQVVLAHGSEAVITTRTHNMLRQLNMISTTS